MEENEYTYMSNGELSLKMDKLREEFEDRKSIIAKAYEDMIELNKEYAIVEKIFKKQGRRDYG